MKETTTGNKKKKKNTELAARLRGKKDRQGKSKRSDKAASKESPADMQMDSSSSRAAVIIRAYNEEQHIGRLLTGIMHQTADQNSLAYAPEIILVDSGSTDATVAIASQYAVKVVHIQPEEFTFGHSLNIGISAANPQAEFIAIASAHVYPVYPDWLDRLLSPFADNHVGLTYGKQRGAEGTKFSERQIFAHWFPDANITQPMIPSQLQSHSRQAHPFCNNANAAIRRSLWQKRPYDETLTGLEDLEWARWMMEQGYSIIYVPEAEIIHVHSETPRGVYNRYRREAIAFKHIYPQETFDLGDFLRLVSANIFSDLRQAARQKELQANLGSIFWFRWMQFLGTYRGYRYAGPVTAQLRKTFYYPPGAPISGQNHPRGIAPIQYNGAEDRHAEDRRTEDRRMKDHI